MSPRPIFQPAEVRELVESTLGFRALPPQAERDVWAALQRVPADSQALFIWAAEDAALERGTALERLACLWLLNAAVNVADDLADGDCDYLDARVAPGVAFLLQALALLPAARGSLALRCFEDCSIALTRAAAGQSLEVRRRAWGAADYLLVADLIAGEQYAAYLRLLWDGTVLESRALEIGRLIGRVGIVVTDLRSRDVRLFDLPDVDRSSVLHLCNGALAELEAAGVRSVKRFAEFARPIIAAKRADCSRE